MTQADLTIAVYQDAIHICEAVAQTYGPMPQVACRTIVSELQERINGVIDAECHRKTVEAMAS